MAEENSLENNSTTSSSSYSGPTAKNNASAAAGSKKPGKLSPATPRSSNSNNSPYSTSSSNHTNKSNNMHLISKNCKRFNHIFHCSSSSGEDSTSSSDTIIDNNTTTASTNCNSISRAFDSSNLNSIAHNSVIGLAQYPPTNHVQHPSSSTSGSGRMMNTGNNIVITEKVMKKLTNHRISHLLSANGPVLQEPAQETSKNTVVVIANGRDEECQERLINEELAEARRESIRKLRNCSESNISNNNTSSNKDETDYDLEIEIEVEVESSMEATTQDEIESSSNNASNNKISIKNAADLIESIYQEPEAESDSEVDSESKVEEKRKLASQLRRENKKLLLEFRDNEKRKSSRLISRTTFCHKKHEAQIMKKLKQIIKKSPDNLSNEEQQIQDKFPHLVSIIKKRHETRQLATERLKEFEDPPDILEMKCTKLANVISKAKYLVVYTGAGISTSASIPDYRGPNGIWTLLRNGQSLDAQSPTVLTTADPTLTHMAIKTLHSKHIIKHIVSQNCDGLHLRSGIPKTALSEVHGNMYIEVCIKCSREYVRCFDVTEFTRRYEHRTGRHCYHCGSQLKDTVVHFGERGSLKWPLNWAGAEYNVARADVIICMGSSLKVLRRYPWLWGMDRPVKKRPKLFIVNLQWTPKDQFAKLKIHGKCDEVMAKVMSKLNIPIPSYKRETDQIFALATPLHESEIHSKAAVELAFPPNKSWPPNPEDINNYIRFEPKFNVEISMDLIIKKEDNDNNDSVKIKEEEHSSNSDSTTLRSPINTNANENKVDSDELTDSKTDIIVSYKRKAMKKRDKSTIIKGNGNGWFGNAWGKTIKKKRKTSTSKS